MKTATIRTCETHPKIFLKPDERCWQCAENAADHGEDKNVVTFVYLSKLDDFGRRSFCIWWWDEKFHSGPAWRAQHFLSDPNPYLEDFRQYGRKIRKITKNV